MRSNKFRDQKISTEFSMKISMKNRDFSISKILVSRFQNALTFFMINRFGRDFFKSCVYFHGGHAGTCFRVSGAFIGDITGILLAQEKYYLFSQK